MLRLLGKEFSKKSIKVRKFLDNKGIDYEFVDIDFDEDALNWIKMNKIISLPVLINGKLFVVGDNEEMILKLISKDT